MSKLFFANTHAPWDGIDYKNKHLRNYYCTYIKYSFKVATPTFFLQQVSLFSSYFFKSCRNSFIYYHTIEKKITKEKNGATMNTIHLWTQVEKNKYTCSIFTSLFFSFLSLNRQKGEEKKKKRKKIIHVTPLIIFTYKFIFCSINIIIKIDIQLWCSVNYKYINIEMDRLRTEKRENGSVLPNKREFFPFVSQKKFQLVAASIFSSSGKRCMVWPFISIRNLIDLINHCLSLFARSVKHR